MADQGVEWIGVEEAARRLGVSHDTVRRLADDGTITSFRTRPGGGHRRLLASSVEECRQQLHGASPDSGA